MINTPFIFGIAKLNNPFILFLTGPSPKEDEMIYRIRRTSILADIRAARANGGRVDQLRMELAALRSCRALVS